MAHARSLAAPRASAALELVSLHTRSNVTSALPSPSPASGMSACKKMGATPAEVTISTTRASQPGHCGRLADTPRSTSPVDGSAEDQVSSRRTLLALAPSGGGGGGGLEQTSVQYCTHSELRPS